MQYNQPYWCTGFQNNAQYQYPTYPYQIPSPCPEVIGEGDVISMTLPDGRVHCYFVPVNRHDQWIPCNANPTIRNSVPVWSNGNNTAWFVRSIINPCPTVESFSSVPNPYGNSHATAYANVNSECQGFIQKFHNDSCTSTTELPYFYPHLRNGWISNNCAGIQVEIPKQERTILHYGTMCSRPCYCGPSGNKTEQSSESPMSVDEVKPTFCCCNREKNRSDKNVTKSNKVCCVCRSQSIVNTSDKAVTTYADQATSCTGKKGCKSQTDLDTGMWFKKKTRSKNIERSSRSPDTCNSSYCLGSTCCCCNSDQTINK